jgi:hypothetical protein
MGKPAKRIIIVFLLELTRIEIRYELMMKSLDLRGRVLAKSEIGKEIQQ